MLTHSRRTMPRREKRWRNALASGPLLAGITCQVEIEGHVVVYPALTGAAERVLYRRPKLCSHRVPPFILNRLQVGRRENPRAAQTGEEA